MQFCIHGSRYGLDLVKASTLLIDAKLSNYVQSALSTKTQGVLYLLWLIFIISLCSINCISILKAASLVRLTL